MKHSTILALLLLGSYAGTVYAAAASSPGFAALSAAAVVALALPLGAAWSLSVVPDVVTALDRLADEQGEWLTLSEAHDEGYDDGFADGFADGKSATYDDGYGDGWDDGYEEAAAFYRGDAGEGEIPGRAAALDRAALREAALREAPHGPPAALECGCSGCDCLVTRGGAA